MYFSLIVSLCVTLVGVVYTFATFALPAAKIGNPVEPKIFPAMLGLSLLVLGTILIFQEVKKLPKDEQAKAEANKKHNFGKNELNIVYTLLNGVLYALLFNRIGYVFSTTIFLEIQLIIFRGISHWLHSLLVAVAFSVIAFLLFDVALGIYLPTSALQFI